MRATEAVLFDLDDTLHDDTAAYRATALHVSAYASERYGIEAPGLVDAYLHEVQHFYEMLSPEHLHIRNQHVQARWWGRALGHYGIRDRAFAGWCSFAFEQSHAKKFARLARCAANAGDPTPSGRQAGSFCQTAFHARIARKLLI